MADDRDHDPMGTIAIDETLALTFRTRSFAAPALVLLLLGASIPGAETWRITAIVVLFAVMAISGAVELALLRRAPAHTGVPRNAAFMVTFVLSTLTLSGGLRSPILPMLIPAGLGLGFLFRGWASRLLAATLVAGMWLVGAASLWVGAETLVLPVLRRSAAASAPGASTWTNAVFMSGFIAAAWTVGRRVRIMFERVIALTNERNEAVLEGQREQTRALAALSSEIAHELKNPLATVKGLAALVARDASGKAAERAAVLRREIDRMHGVLDELLNFSRPLSELSLARVEAAELISEVARLHEGMASAASVTIAAAPPERAIRVRCDRRKVLQALVNLVQNAIEASPRGAMVKIGFEERGERAAFLVEDEGGGVPAEIRARLFEPGVTSKRSGSGLGLTIARAIAGQHGGDIALEDGARGAVLALLLPVAGPAEKQGGARDVPREEERT
jgi:signal transduction histidine kinase